jgi:hypothetical protein
MMQRTIEVAHPEAHEPTIEQLRSAVVSSLKEEGLKLNGEYSASLRSQTSGQSSTYRVTFEADEIPKGKRAAAAKKAEPEPEHPTIDDADKEKP